MFEPFSLLKPRTWNNRLHDKLIIVDNKIGLIGGRNIGDKYFVENKNSSTYSKDRDVIIYDEKENKNKDSSLYAMSKYFNYIFFYKHSKQVDLRISKSRKRKMQKEKERLKDLYKTFQKDYKKEVKEIDWKSKTYKSEGVKFVFNPIARGSSDPWVYRKLLKLANESKSSILIQSPYIIPTKNMREKFKKISLKDKEVTMLTNSLSSSPNLIAIAGYLNYKQRLVESDVKLFEYQGPRSIHGKSYIFDNNISVVGSFNFDACSFYLNSESMVIVWNVNLTKNLY